MLSKGDKVGVLCVDDNPQMADALKNMMLRTEPFEWKGWLPDAEKLPEVATKTAPSLVLLDIDLPGRDPLDAAEEVVQECPDTRFVVFTGHVRLDLIDRALQAGVWGYVSKNDGEGELMSVLRKVMEGEVAFSTEVRAVCQRA